MPEPCLEFSAVCACLRLSLVYPVIIHHATPPALESRWHSASHAVLMSWQWGVCEMPALEAPPGPLSRAAAGKGPVESPGSMAQPAWTRGLWLLCQQRVGAAVLPLPVPRGCSCHVLSSQCAVGHEYVADVGKHSSQTDAAQGFGGKFGVQRDRADKVCWTVRLQSRPVACAGPGALPQASPGCAQSSGHAGCALCPGLAEAQLV